jgi:hypothetical protein
MQCTFYIAGKQTTGVPHIQRENKLKNYNGKPINDSRINKRKKHPPEQTTNPSEERSVQKKKHQHCFVKYREHTLTRVTRGP